MLKSSLNYDTASAAAIVASHVLIQSSSRRFSITFFPPNAGYYTVTVNGPVLLGNGLVITAAQGPITLDILHHGDVIQREWVSISSAAGAVPSWIEALL